jgi:N-acetyl-1-D-myo-inositol-2-amino-2-deoxy-alpha-D-glucopyranoside deacetylase
VTSPLRMVIVFAHPDDESFGFGGLLSAMTDLGHETTYVVATRGEAGEILVPGLATREDIGEVREGELRAALDILGIRDLRILGYRDSGMAGSAENAHPRAFVNQDADIVSDQVVEVLLEKRPDIVLTYGPDGIYGHPDHIMASTVATAAVHKAGDRGWQTPNLYYSAAPKPRIKWMAEIPNGPFKSTPPEEVARLGTPSSEISTWLDVSAYYPRKLAALRAHRTQVGDDGPLAHLSEADRRMWFSLETARMVPLPWNPDPDDVLSSLLPTAAADHLFRV